MGWRFNRVARVSFFNLFACFSLLAGLLLLKSEVRATPWSDDDKPTWPYSWPETKAFGGSKDIDRLSSWDSNRGFGDKSNQIFRTDDFDEEHQRITEMATKTVVAIIIILVLLSFVAFLVCLCCPICLLAKMRQRRRGFVYQTAATNGTSTTVATSGATVTVINNRNAGRANQMASPPPSTMSNGGNSAYPVQPAVTVMPHPSAGHPQQYQPYPNQGGAPYPMGQPGMPMPGNVPPPNDLPPPYPGLPREMDNLNQQPAFNPYFGGAADAPNPYMPTTAPYPTK